MALHLDPQKLHLNLRNKNLVNMPHPTCERKYRIFVFFLNLPIIFLFISILFLLFSFFNKIVASSYISTSLLSLIIGYFLTEFLSNFSDQNAINKENFFWKNIKKIFSTNIARGIFFLIFACINIIVWNSLINKFVPILSEYQNQFLAIANLTGFSIGTCLRALFILRLKKHNFSKYEEIHRIFLCILLTLSALGSFYGVNYYLNAYNWNIVLFAGIICLGSLGIQIIYLLLIRKNLKIQEYNLIITPFLLIIYLLIVTILFNFELPNYQGLCVSILIGSIFPVILNSIYCKKNGKTASRNIAIIFSTIILIASYLAATSGNFKIIELGFWGVLISIFFSFLTIEILIPFENFLSPIAYLQTCNEETNKKDLNSLFNNKKIAFFIIIPLIILLLILWIKTFILYNKNPFVAPQTSVILIGHNQAKSLKFTLSALKDQKDAKFEVIVGDDGSSDNTKELVECFGRNAPFSVKYVYQKHEGFRAARIRNLSVKEASGDYLIFLDGDVVPRPDFIKNHQKLAEGGFFVQGSRILCSENFTKKIISDNVELHKYSIASLILLFFNKSLKRDLIQESFQTISLASITEIFTNRFQNLTEAKKGIMSCNLAVWKKDFLKINGFNQDFIGWGHEDLDLALRLINNNVLRKESGFVIPIFHLWHPKANRDKELANRNIVEKNESLHSRWAVNGFDKL